MTMVSDAEPQTLNPGPETVIPKPQTLTVHTPHVPDRNGPPRTRRQLCLPQAPAAVGVRVWRLWLYGIGIIIGLYSLIPYEQSVSTRFSFWRVCASGLRLTYWSLVWNGGLDPDGSTSPIVTNTMVSIVVPTSALPTS